MRNAFGWLLTTASLFALNFQSINQVLTIIISILSIVWLTIKIYKSFKGDGTDK
jgi:hypothetical protein